MLFDLSYKLDPDEQLVGLVRKHWFLLAPRLVEYLAIIILLIFFVNRFFAFRQTLIVTTALAVGYFIYFAYRWVLWRADYYVITNKRIIRIIQSGFLDRELGEVSVNDIRDAAFKTRGIAATILKFGTIKVNLKDGRVFKMEDVAYPDKIYQTVVKLKEIID